MDECQDGTCQILASGFGKISEQQRRTQCPSWQSWRRLRLFLASEMSTWRFSKLMGNGVSTRPIGRDLIIAAWAPLELLPTSVFDKEAGSPLLQGLRPVQIG